MIILVGIIAGCTNEIGPSEVESLSQGVNLSSEVISSTEILSSVVATSSEVVSTSSSSANEGPCRPEGEMNQTISALFLGNSLLGGVSTKLNSLLQCGGYTPEVMVYNPGGYKLYQHNSNSTSISYKTGGTPALYQTWGYKDYARE